MCHSYALTSTSRRFHEKVFYNYLCYNKPLLSDWLKALILHIFRISLIVAQRKHTICASCVIEMPPHVSRIDTHTSPSMAWCYKYSITSLKYLTRSIYFKYHPIHCVNGFVLLSDEINFIKGRATWLLRGAGRFLSDKTLFFLTNMEDVFSVVKQRNNYFLGDYPLGDFFRSIRKWDTSQRKSFK